MVNEIINFKNYLSQFTSMDDGSFDIALDCLQVEKISRGEYLVMEGRKCSKIAYIDKGIFRIYYLKEGNEINTCFCKENSITSSFNCFINNVPANEYIQALEDSVVVTLLSTDLLKLTDQSKKWQLIRQLLTVN